MNRQANKQRKSSYIPSQRQPVMTTIVIAFNVSSIVKYKTLVPLFYSTHSLAHFFWCKSFALLREIISYLNSSNQAFNSHSVVSPPDATAHPFKQSYGACRIRASPHSVRLVCHSRLRCGSGQTKCLRYTAWLRGYATQHHLNQYR